MFNQSYNFSKILIIVIVSLVFFSCDEDYVNSLNPPSPKAFLEATNDLDDFYLGDSLNLELILKVADSPNISNLVFSLSCDPMHFNPESVLISPSENNLFYNISSEAVIDYFTAFTDSTFEINLGFLNSQDTTYATYTYGDGEIARLYLNARNVQSVFDLSLDNVLSYDFDTDIEDWDVQNLIIGKPIPEILFDEFNYNNESGLLTMKLKTIKLPELTDSQISITYNHDLISFINEDTPTEGDLLNQGFDLEFSETEVGKIVFNFNQIDGNITSFIEGDGTLVTLKFNLIADVNTESSIQLNLESAFSESIFDVCGECENPTVSEHFDYDVSFWNKGNQVIELVGCADPEALNYNEDAIFDDESCNYSK